MSKYAHLTITLLILFLSSGCEPDQKQIRQDFFAIAEKEIGQGARFFIKWIAAGEGDSDNVYEHVKFDVVIEKDLTFRNGWFLNELLQKGDKLCDGEAILLYQDIGSGWQMTGYDLKNKPKKAACKAG